jgi:DNA-binding MarR family transcriptional regulator
VKTLQLPCYCGSLRQAARAVTQMYDRLLQPSGIKITQFSILMLLSSRPGLTTGEIARALAMDSTTLTRTLKIIKNSGWIDTARSVDRRERRWTVTPTGEQALRQAKPLWKKAQKELAQKAAGIDLDALGMTLYALTEHVAQNEPA